MIPFTCSHCGHVGRVKPEFAGKRVKCPACHVSSAVTAIQSEEQWDNTVRESSYRPAAVARPPVESPEELPAPPPRRAAPVVGFHQGFKWGCGALLAVGLGVAAVLFVVVVLPAIMLINRASERMKAEKNAPPPADVEFALAGRDTVTVDDVAVSVTAWSVDKIQYQRRGISADQFLIVDVRVATLSPGRKVNYVGWSDADGVEAVDELGNSYYLKRHFIDRPEGSIGYATIYKDQPASDRLIIERPVAAAREIRLTLPSGNVSRVAAPPIRFRLPLKPN